MALMILGCYWAKANPRGRPGGRKLLFDGVVDGEIAVAETKRFEISDEIGPKFFLLFTSQREKLLIDKDRPEELANELASDSVRGRSKIADFPFVSNRLHP